MSTRARSRCSRSLSFKVVAAFSVKVTVPLVVRTANGGGLGFGAQHSQAVENWAFAIPGLKVVAPATPSDVVGLMAAAIRSDDPVVFFEHKGLFASKGEPAPPDHLVELGRARVARCLVPLDATTVLASVERTNRLLVVEENPYQGGWGATVAAIVADEGYETLDAPVRRLAAECVPLPFADALEDQVIPTVDKLVTAIRRLAAY